jgi:cytochrome oxidase Cu insertion factor (SCO1/SenC/PrrC family)
MKSSVFAIVAALISATIALGQVPSYPKPQIPAATGQPAPDFTLKDQDGKPFTLSAQQGHWILLFFYRGYW